MGMNFTFEESSALLGLLAESSSDIILKTDAQGFIVNATRAIEELGIREPELLLGPHLLDLVVEDSREMVREALDRALCADGNGGNASDGGWVEFPAVTDDERQRWYEIRFKALNGEDGEAYGAIGIMRSVDERRTLNEKLFAATYTDPLTGLTNRGAFISMLEHMLESGMDGCLAMFSIDFFRTINMQHGQQVGDDVLIVFADLLREMLRADDIVSRIGSERFAVLLPRTTPQQAEAICRRVVTTLADLRRKVGESQFAITASGSVAAISGTLDSTIERAEMALFVAKAKGRNRLEMESTGRLAAI